MFPVSRAKVPLVADWPNVATTDPEQVAAWWREFPRASIGFATGELVVIDVDGAEGIATRYATEAEGLEWPITLTAATGRKGGGIHLYYRAPDGVEIRNCAGLRGGRGIGPGIDVRGRGGLTVLPPSPHVSGRAYDWLIRCAPATIPWWMMDRLKPPSIIPRHEAPARDTSRYAAAALDGECFAIETAPDGQQNTQINVSAFNLGRRFVAAGTLRESVVFEALLAAALRGGHPEKRARATVRSGLSAGMARRR